MAVESNRSKRPHHPVDSLCRKLQSINMMDQASNPALQIPKFQSKSFDSPQGNVKKNLEEILKRRTWKLTDSSTLSYESGLISPLSDNVFSPGPQMVTPSHKRISDIRAETFLVGKNKEKVNKPWLLMNQTGCCSPNLSKRGEPALPQHCGSTEVKTVPSQNRTYLTSSPDLSSWELKPMEPMIQSPVCEKFSLGWGLSTKEEEIANVSLISEEDLLTTMFSACDVERRGKVAVSKLVDFLRYTTSRSSEDSSLEELCNMLDPDQRDISMDLETYHAIMKEWIDDCRRNGNESPSKGTNESNLPARRTPGRLNVTSGSLEAVGGEVSRGDLETSDLITCVADLQFNNQKLQEENCQLKMSLDAMEEANNKLMEDSTELRNQIKSFQQTVTQLKTLKEDLEEAKHNINAVEEKRQKMAAQNKQLEKENQSLVLKISSLQEENIRHAMDSDGLQKKINELSKNMAELQKDLNIQELKSTIKEYSCVIETLRVEKNKLVDNIQQMQQELISNGLHFPITYKFSGSIHEEANSLHCELELAQQPPEIPGMEWTAIDESLDREVLLLLHGPEFMGEKFKAIFQKLKKEVSQLEELVGLWGMDFNADPPGCCEKKLMDLRQIMGNKRTLWLQELDLLEAQKESLDKELISMAGNLRRMKTEQLHLKKTLSSRQHELELVKKLKDDAVANGDDLRLTLQEVNEKLEDATLKFKGQEEDLCAALEEVKSLQKKLEESNAQRVNLQGINESLALTCQDLELRAKKQNTAFDSVRTKHSNGLLCKILCEVLFPLEGFFTKEMFVEKLKPRLGNN